MLGFAYFPVFGYVGLRDTLKWSRVFLTCFEKNKGRLKVRRFLSDKALRAAPSPAAAPALCCRRDQLPSPVAVTLSLAGHWLQPERSTSHIPNNHVKHGILPQFPASGSLLIMVREGRALKKRETERGRTLDAPIPWSLDAQGLRGGLVRPTLCAKGPPRALCSSFSSQPALGCLSPACRGLVHGVGLRLGREPTPSRSQVALAGFLPRVKGGLPLPSEPLINLVTGGLPLVVGVFPSSLCC